ncbi:MAG: hypothetical protein JSV89_01485, partial [Spirochaetaceae bacterium]
TLLDRKSYLDNSCLQSYLYKKSGNYKILFKPETLVKVIIIARVKAIPSAALPRNFISSGMSTGSRAN